MVECWSPKPVVRVRVLVFLSLSFLASWVKLAFLFSELIHNLVMNRERVIQKFRKKQKHIKKSKKWGRKKIEEIRNRGKNAVETIQSIFMSLGSKCSGLPGVSATISKPQTISPASLAFANRYSYLKKKQN